MSIEYFDIFFLFLKLKFRCIFFFFFSPVASYSIGIKLIEFKVEEYATKCVYLLTQLQPPQERLDCGQVSKLGAVSRGTTDPESLIGKTTTMQGWSVSSGSRHLLRKGQKFIEPFRNPDNRARTSSSSFVDDHSPSHRVSVPLKRRLTALKSHKLYFFVFFFCIFYLISPCLFNISIIFFLFLKLKFRCIFFPSFLRSHPSQ